MATLNGTLQRPDGSAVTGYVRFSIVFNPTVRSSVLALSSPVDVALAADGTFTVSLCQGTYWVTVAGVAPWMIQIVSDVGTYRIENVTLWTVQGRGRVSVWLWNADTSMYHRIMSSSKGGVLGIIPDEHGVAYPLGFLATSLLIQSITDSLYYDVSLSGVGSEIGITINTTGQATPLGDKYAEVLIPSMDGDWMNSIKCVGTGAEVGLVVT